VACHLGHKLSAVSVCGAQGTGAPRLSRAACHNTRAVKERQSPHILASSHPHPQDDRFDHLVATYRPKSVVPAVLTATDIAGLVKGASEGQGLGNAFLSHIAAVDGIFHMARAFGGDEVTHVEGSVDPVRDLDIIHNELLMKDLANVQGKVDTSRKNVERKLGGKEAKEEFDTLEKALALMKAGKDIRAGDWTSNEIEHLNRQQLLTAKPMVYLVNLSEKDYIRKRNKFLEPLAKWLEARGSGDKMIPFSCEFEQKIFDMTPEAREAYCKENGTRSAMPRIIKTGYHVLGLIHYFTAGHDEVRAWTIKGGTLAPAAAGVIHSDFQKNFIAAEVFNFDDFKEHGSEAAVKAAGKSRTQGKQYEMVDGDIVYFKHG
jgi:obg-like ATPase 1